SALPVSGLPFSRGNTTTNPGVGTGVEKSLFSLGIIDPVTTRLYTWYTTPMRQTPRENTFENGYCWPMPLKLNDLVTVYTSSWPKPPNIRCTTSSQAASTLSRIPNKRILKKNIEGSSAQRVNGSSRLATALSASSRSFLLMLVGTTPTPWSSRSPGSLPPPNVVPPRRQLPLVLPPPRCIADESIPADILTHWRSMPRSRERRRPQPPTFPTLQPPSRSQTRALGRVGRRLPPLTKPLSVPIVQARQRDETWSTR
ncbi:hypothetical protein ALC56_10491, partial [Trachymyrmex septentrionalis]